MCAGEASDGEGDSDYVSDISGSVVYSVAGWL